MFYAYCDVNYPLIMERCYALPIHNEAAKILREAINISLDSIQVWIYLGHFQYSSGQLQKAMKAYEEVCENYFLTLDK